MVENSSDDKIRNAVRENYAKVATTSSCGCGPTCCSNSSNSNLAADASIALGYSSEDVQSAPEGSNMGLGCGNPQAIAELKQGETVLDLGCGGGFDCFLASRKVGTDGLVIGVDMTPEMVSKARKNVRDSGETNIDIRLGEIENLPVADNSIDVIISNCVINLSPNKQRVFKEAFRVLKAGGRLAISDVIASTTIPEDIKKDLVLHAGCIAGASTQNEVIAMLKEAGFNEIRVKNKEESKSFIKDWAPGSGAENYVVSANIQAIKL
ncbi:MAG: arsenite methyltransferase [Clostridiaceae bacterium]|jgi:SAM-dependent methyltransferase|nr:arsenite methyltransferase [Clostridiaceae bacterium]